MMRLAALKDWPNNDAIDYLNLKGFAANHHITDKVMQKLCRDWRDRSSFRGHPSSC